MKQINISITAANGLCSSCGVCKGICPKECIHWNKDGGMYLPQIDASACVSCGLCASVCPGLGHSYEPKENAIASVTGNVLACYNAWSNNPTVRHISASGGVVSTMVDTLLSTKYYDSVFCVDSYDYRNQLVSQRHDIDNFYLDSDKANTPKSRYLPVSHEQTIRHIKANRNERVIIIATSCALRGITAVIDQLKLKRENYLLIGLFCDKVFNYNSLSYFENSFSPNATVEALHFKNKESGGWPGDMKIFPENGSPFYVPLAERAKAKAYFMPERCLYCVDKLNVQADISLGDNYTGINESPLGSNSVIIRTHRGLDAWDAVRGCIEALPVDIKAVQNAQYLEGRLHNLYFGDLKVKHMNLPLDLNIGVQREQNSADYSVAWKSNQSRLQSGLVYDKDPSRLQKQMLSDSKDPNPILSFIRRGYHYIKRKLS